MLPGLGVDEGALLEVVEENVALAAGDGFVVNESVDLEVLLKAAGVDVGRTDGHEVVVAHHGFGVEEPLVVEIDFDASGQQVAEVGLGGSQCDSAAVGDGGEQGAGNTGNCILRAA